METLPVLPPKSPWTRWSAALSTMRLTSIISVSRQKIGQNYEIRANYRLSQMPEARLWLFAPDGMTQVERFVDIGRTRDGKYLEWAAPIAAKHHIVLWSPEGDVGDYTLEVLSGFDR